MKDFITVFGYTFRENARKKAFIISSIIIIALTVGLMLVPAAIELFGNKNEKGEKSDGDQEKSTSVVYIIDAKGILKDDISSLEKVFPDYKLHIKTDAEIITLKEDVKKDQNKSLMILDEKNGVPYFDYFISKYGSGPNPEIIGAGIKNIYVSTLLKAASVPEATAAKVLSTVTFSVNELGKGALKSYVTSMIIMMILFFAVYFYGYGVAMSVASEKTSRVMEILITSTKPAKIILGKSAAMGLLGLCQLSAILIAAILTYKLTFPDNFQLAGMKLDFSNFTPFSILMIIVYFILGYSLYSMMNAVAGATVSKAEDVNSAIMPISMITLVSFYFAYGTIMLPGNSLAQVASLIPFSSPFSMPCRILSSDVPIMQIVASISILIVSIVLMALISIKLYSSAILHYGKRIKINELLKMSKREQ